MKKIYTRSVFVFDPKKNQYIVDESESEFHYISDDTPIIQMKGGGKKKAEETRKETTTQTGSSSSSGTTVQNPWGPQIPYLEQGFAEARKRFLEANPEYFPGETVAGFSPETEDFLSRMLQRGREGSALGRGAQESAGGLLSGDFYGQGGATGGAIQDYIGSNLRGDYLYGGQGFNKALEAAMNAQIPGIDSTFARGGRSGSGLAETAKNQAFADAFARQYGQERDRQMQSAGLGQQGLEAGLRGRLGAIGAIPGLTEMDYRDIGAIGGVGQMRDDLSQRRIDENVNRYNYNRDIKRKMLEDYMRTISGNYGGTTTSNQTGTTSGSGTTSGTGTRTQPGANPWQSAFGGGLTGAGIGSMFGPYGALIGAGVGAGGGLLSSWF